MPKKQSLFIFFYENFENFDIYIDKILLLWYYILVISYTDGLNLSILRLDGCFSCKKPKNCMF